MNLAVEAVGPEDWRRWRELRLRALAEDSAAFARSAHGWIRGGDTEERWRERLAGDDRFFIASDRGVDLGIVGASPRGDGSVELISMWVAGTRRGRGIGRILVQRVLEVAQTRPVVLRVMADNASAVGFYLAMGFAFDGAVPDEEGTLTMRRPAPGLGSG
ncbi:GNAT family N-acetyltransferase [Aeromicrobium phragmitis]|nr:GNAT family N-acetyltransferase [Aeromicrobium phragmitis]